MIEQTPPPLDHDSIIKRVEAHLAAGMTRKRIALICDITEGELDRVLSGIAIGHEVDFEGPRTRDVFAALEEWLSENAVPVGDDSGYAVTPTFQYIQTLLSHAHQGRTLLAITGVWGTGKTRGGMFYAAKHARGYQKPGAVRIQFNSTDNKPAAALARIRDALAATGGAYRNGALFDSIGDALKPGDFLILDECQRLGDALDTVCSLHDDYGIGIAMIGNPDLSGKLWGKRPAFGALASRAVRFDITHATKEDALVWLDWRGIPPGLTVKQRSALIEACIEVVQRPTYNGGLRALAHVFDTAQSMYSDKPLTAEFFLQLVNTIKPGGQQ